MTSEQAEGRGARVWRWLWTPLTPDRPHHSVGAVLLALLLLAALWLFGR